MDEFFKKMREIQKKERTNSSLARVGTDFYQRIHKYIAELNDLVGNDPFANEHYLLKDTQRIATEICERREHKITDSAVMNIHRSYHLFKGEPTFDLHDTTPLNLTPEEEGLYFSLIDVLKNHKGNISLDTIKGDIKSTDSVIYKDIINNHDNNNNNKSKNNETRNENAKKVKSSASDSGTDSNNFNSNNSPNSSIASTKSSTNVNDIINDINRIEGSNKLTSTNDDNINNVNANLAKDNSFNVNNSNSSNSNVNTTSNNDNISNIGNNSDNSNSINPNINNSNINNTISGTGSIKSNSVDNINEEFPNITNIEKNDFENVNNLIFKCNNANTNNAHNSNFKSTKSLFSKDELSSSTLLVFDEVPAIVCGNEKVYGPLNPQDIVTIPKINAKIIVKSKKGRFVKS